MNADKTGEPILRSLEYEFPHRGYHAVKDEFLMGDDLLVVPMVSPGTRREAVIPPGTWRAGDAARDLPALEVAARAIPISICSAAVTTFCLRVVLEFGFIAPCIIARETPPRQHAFRRRVYGMLVAPGKCTC